MSIIFTSARRINPSRPFGLGLGRNQSERLPKGPNPADAAWVAGFNLGLEFVDADPSSDLPPWQAEAFMAGHDAGRKEAEAERLAFSDAFDRETMAIMEREYEAEESERREMACMAWAACCSEGA